MPFCIEIRRKRFGDSLESSGLASPMPHSCPGLSGDLNLGVVLLLTELARKPGTL
jgi:hypothetical protein